MAQPTFVERVKRQLLMFLMAFVRAFVQIGTYRVVLEIQKESKLLLKSYLQRFFGSLSVKDSPPSTLSGIAYEDRVLMLHDI